EFRRCDRHGFDSGALLRWRGLRELDGTDFGLCRQKRGMARYDGNDARRIAAGNEAGAFKDAVERHVGRKIPRHATRVHALDRIYGDRDLYSGLLAVGVECGVEIA